MNPFVMIGEASTSATQISEFVTNIMGGVTSTISLGDVALIVVALIGSGLAANFAWTYARKGYKFIVNSLKGKNASV